jgi:hypothetical protein
VIRTAVAACCLAAVALTGCSGNEETPSAKGSAPVSSAPTQPLVTGTPSAPTSGRQLRATEVVAGLKGAGYTCSPDSTYQVCKGSGPVAVWVLTGAHPRVAVVSLHATGAVATAHHAIAAELPKVLGIAHIDDSAKIAGWYGGQTGKTTASTTIGDWRIDLSAEQGTDQPGVHLTLNDKLCKRNCQAE